MSKEQKFHKLIEQQDIETKRALWERIEEQLNSEGDREIKSDGNAFIISQKKRLLAIRLAIVLTAVLALAAVISIILVVKLKSTAVDDIRFCNEGDYYWIDSELNIKQYSQQNGINLSYFDWYEEIEYFADKQFKLYGSDEVICLYEELFDVNDVYIKYYIIDNKIEMDILKSYADLCTQSSSVNSINVNWGQDLSEAYAFFEFKEHKYYLIIEDAAYNEYILELINYLIG